MTVYAGGATVSKNQHDHGQAQHDKADVSGDVRLRRHPTEHRGKYQGLTNCGTYSHEAFGKILRATALSAVTDGGPQVFQEVAKQDMKN